MIEVVMCIFILSSSVEISKASDILYEPAYKEESND